MNLLESEVQADYVWFDEYEHLQDMVKIIVRKPYIIHSQVLRSLGVYSNVCVI